MHAYLVYYESHVSLAWFLQKLEEDLHMFGMKIKQHEDNIKFLKTQKNKLDESILDLQGILSIIVGNWIYSKVERRGQFSVLAILCYLPSTWLVLATIASKNIY